jgi:hypothetical protein
MATTPEPTEAEMVSRPSEGFEGGTRTQAEGITKILAPAVATREGSRILIFGRTRWGKSTFAISLVQAMLDAGVASSALIHDVKYPDRQQYEGVPVHTPADLTALQGSRVAVFRPPMPAAMVAAAGRTLTENGEPTVILMDETRRALASEKKWIDSDDEDGHVNKGPKNLEWHFLEAGGVRGSVVLLVQTPRTLPGHAVDSSQANVFFGLAGPSLNYSVSAGIVPPEAASTVERLPPGAFCIFTCDENWDREIYYSPLGG